MYVWVRNSLAVWVEISPSVVFVEVTPRRIVGYAALTSPTLPSELIGLVVPLSVIGLDERLVVSRLSVCRLSVRRTDIGIDRALIYVGLPPRIFHSCAIISQDVLALSS